MARTRELRQPAQEGAGRGSQPGAEAGVGVGWRSARGGHKLQCRRGARQVVPWGQWLSYKAGRKVGSVQTRNTSCIEGAVVSRLQLKAAGHVGDITDLMDVSLSELRELVLDREAWRAAVHGVTKFLMRETGCGGNWVLF